MLLHTILLRKPKPKPSKALHSLTTTITRSMGGGPRTFPGGLNKWQWKRLHEKKAMEKEKRLLDQEKQLYQARLRSQIRSTVSEPGSASSVAASSHKPMSPQDHIKALADRFLKDGAEDLWNDDDGPPRNGPGGGGGPVSGPDREVDLTKVFGDVGSGGKGCFGNFGGKGNVGNLQQKRGYVATGRDFGSGFLKKMETFSGNGGNSGFYGNGGFSNLKGFSGNLQQMRGYVGSSRGNGSGILMNLRDFDGKLSNWRNNGEGFLGKFDSFYGNLQQKRGYLANGRNVDGGFLLKLDSFCGDVQQRRGYAGNAMKGKSKGGFKGKSRKFRKAGSSSDDDEEDYGSVEGNARWPKFSLEGDEVERGDQDEEEGGKGGGRSVRAFMGNAKLGKYDVKTTKRRIMKELEDYAEREEEEGNMNQKTEEIRQEFNARKLGDKGKEEVKEKLPLVTNDVDEFAGTLKRFEDCGISPLTVKALTEAGYVQLTRVQEATLSICLEGKDAFVKARSGTGKTTAFLLPAIETVLNAMNSKGRHRVPPIYALILCPTRELASQIAAETRVLLKHHDGLGVQMLAGGTRFKDDLKHLESDPCQILVATPGRLLDHVESRSALSVRLTGLKLLVLDEADRLLDLGFRRDVEKIVDCIPRQRQSLLFSATVPKEVRRVSQLVLHREHSLINTVDAGCPETSSKVKQSCIIAPHDTHFQTAYQLLKEHIAGTPDYKVIVFCTTGMVTSLMYNLFREMRLNVREIHSRKPPLYRTRIIDEFKQSKRVILISSDVSARGLNYPDVTLVIQVGVPTDREQYMHRLGRTGREGKDGEGILVLAPWEEHFLDDIRDLPVEKSPAPRVSQDLKVKMEDSMAKIETSVREAAYHAWLGYYNSLRETGRDKTSLVQRANEFSESIGLEEPPALYRKTVNTMGLKGIPGIRIRK